MFLPGVRIWIPLDCVQWLCLAGLDTKRKHCYSFDLSYKFLSTTMPVLEHYCIFHFCHQNFSFFIEIYPPPLLFRFHHQSITHSPIYSYFLLYFLSYFLTCFLTYFFSTFYPIWFCYFLYVAVLMLNSLLTCFLVSLELAEVFSPMLHSTQSEYSRLYSPLSLILGLVILLGVLGAGEGSNFTTKQNPMKDTRLFGVFHTSDLWISSDIFTCCWGECQQFDYGSRTEFLHGKNLSLFHEMNTGWKNYFFSHLLKLHL